MLSFNRSLFSFSASSSEGRFRPTRDEFCPSTHWWIFHNLATKGVNYFELTVFLLAVKSELTQEKLRVMRHVRDKNEHKQTRCKLTAIKNLQTWIETPLTAAHKKCSGTQLWRYWYHLLKHEVVRIRIMKLENFICHLITTAATNVNSILWLLLITINERCSNRIWSICVHIEV